MRAHPPLPEYLPIKKKKKKTLPIQRAKIKIKRESKNPVACPWLLRTPVLVSECVAFISALNKLLLSLYSSASGFFFFFFLTFLLFLCFFVFLNQILLEKPKNFLIKPFWYQYCPTCCSLKAFSGLFALILLYVWNILPCISTWVNFLSSFKSLLIWHLHSEKLLNNPF